MSATLLTRLKSHLDAASLNDGYAVRYFRWTDADIDGNTPLILYRQSGNGQSDIDVQEIRVTITLVGTPTTVGAADTRMQAIIRYLRGATNITGVARFDPFGAVVGAQYLENGRPVFSLTVSCYAEDQ